MSRQRPVRGGEAGQASIEVIGALPAILLAALLAWQLVAVLGAAMRAEEQVRAEAIARATDGERGTLIVSRRVEVPRVLPGAGGFEIGSRAVVRVP